MENKLTYEQLEQKVKTLEVEAARRKQAEEALRENELIFNEAQRIATTGSWHLDLKTGVQKISPMMREIYGIDTDTITVDQGWELVHPDDKKKAQEAAAGAVASGSAPIEYRIVRPDGEVRTVFTPGALVMRDEAGNPSRLIGVSQDITERKQAEKTLRASEERYRTMFEGAVEGIVIADIETKRLRFGNPAYCGMLGYSSDEIERLGIADVHPQSALDHVLAEFEAQVKGRKTLAPDVPCLRKDGKIIYADIKATHLEIEGRDSLVGFFTDITERKLADESAREHQAQLAHFTRLRTLQEMTTELAHEIDQPLCAIMTNSHACLRMIRSGTGAEGELVDALEEVVAQVQRANDVVRRIRGFARKREPERESVDINEIIRESLGMLRTEIIRYDIKVQLLLFGGGPDERPPLYVLADTILIETVIVNLIRNAIDAIVDNKNGKREVTISTDCTGGTMVVISVADTGTGIEEHEADRVFEPFNTTKPEGLGIGLSLGRSIVESHDGRLWLEPNPGGGAVFCFTLPVA